MEIYKDLSSSASKEFEKLLSSQLSKVQIEEGKIIEGKINKITEKFVFLFVEGLKSEPVLDINELKSMGLAEKIKIGETIKVLLEKIEDKHGEVLVSASKAQKIAGWDKLVSAYENNEPIMGKITSKCKGGCIVEHIDTGSLMFLPGSQISDKPLKDISHLMNEPQKFALIKLDKIRGNACVSRREIISSFKKEDKAKIIEKYKVGMIIKIPKKNTSIAFGNDEIVNLEASIRNYDAKTVALLLPFNSHKITNDSLSKTEERIKRDRVMRISLDFYSGALVALEEGKQKGLSTTLRVFDTEQSTSKVRAIINDNNFNDVDVVVGPLLNSTVEEASALLNRKDIPVISPLSSRKANGRENLIQSRPTDDMLHEVMLSYLETMHTDQNIVILADDNASSIKSLITSKFPTASTLKKQEDNFVYQNDVSKQLVSGKDNWFIVATEDVALLSNLLSYLNLSQVS